MGNKFTRTLVKQTRKRFRLIYVRLLQCNSQMNLMACKLQNAASIIIMHDCECTFLMALANANKKPMKD